MSTTSVFLEDHQQYPHKRRKTVCKDLFLRCRFPLLGTVALGRMALFSTLTEPEREHPETRVRRRIVAILYLKQGLRHHPEDSCFSVRRQTQSEPCQQNSRGVNKQFLPNGALVTRTKATPQIRLCKSHFPMKQMSSFRQI